ncbi:MAG: DUF4374 domain-containing protein [Prevotellaceae bacterium]|nr:DUF4374 domain-containing protein [Prevotellaceae bacterium]
MERKSFFKYALMSAALSFAVVSCSDDDDNDGGSTTTVDPAEVEFVVVAGDPETDLTGGVYMKVYSDLTLSRTNESVYGATDALKCADGFTQETYNSQSGVFTGYIYARAAASEENGGIGSGLAGLRSYSFANSSLTEIGSPVYLSNFGNTGTFGTYSYAAQISSPVVEIVDNTGASKTVTIDPTTYAIDEVNPAISNIVDMGNNTVAIVMTYSNRDSAVVAFADYNLNISKVIYSGEIGTSVGAQRSVRYSQSAADDDGNVYVFCGSSSVDSRVGALRINAGTTEFDSSYKFDILSAADGYRFRKAFHISGDKFLLEFFTSTTDYANMSESGKLAIADMSEKTITWVSGIPDPSAISITWGDGYNGSYYLPVSAATSFSGGSSSETTITPTIYKIDASTGVATAFMTFTSSDLLKAIKIIK